MCCNCCSVLQKKIWLITTGILCVAIGVTFIALSPKAKDYIASVLLPLGPNSWMFKKWLNPPMTSYMYIYLFNWTNIHEARNPNVKPNFNEHGPYVFRETRSKEDIIWHGNDTMTYYNRRTWFFVEEMSSGSLDDDIILPHPPTVIAAKEVQNSNRYVKKILNYFLKTEGGSLGVNKKASEWIFKGFPDPIIEFVGLFLTELTSLRLEKFGFLYGRNASKTYEGTYTIHTGQQNLSMLGELNKWHGKTQSRGYEGECSRINGSTGDLFPPGRGPEEIVSVFIPDTCRSIILIPKEKMMYRGVESVKYATSDMTFDSGQLYPNMECYCPGKDGSKCPRTGVIDLGSCFFGAPLYMSLPHFLNADPSYAAAITGMTPDPEKHDFYMIIEPILGAPLNGNANMQINMLVEPHDSIEILKDVNEFYAPMIIFSERGDMDESFVRLIRIFFKTPGISLGFGIAFLVIGLILLSTVAYLSCTNKWKENRRRDDIFSKKN